eukprot:6749627-Prymnesium_polylepis.1
MSTFGFPCRPVRPQQPDPTPMQVEAPVSDPNEDLKNKVRELLIELRTVTYEGGQFEVARANKMDKNAFFAYKETLKLCKPRFRFDKDGSVTGETVWYRRVGGAPKRKQTQVSSPVKRRKADNQPGVQESLELPALDVPLMATACVRNIQSDAIENAVDLRRIIGAIRAAGEEHLELAYDLYRRCAKKPITLPLVIESGEVINSLEVQLTPRFEELWVETDETGFEGCFVPLHQQILSHYSRGSNRMKHAIAVAGMLWGGMWYKHAPSEVDLRDFVIYMLGDEFITVDGDDAIYIWWENRWSKNMKLDRLGHVILEAVRTLYEAQSWGQKLAHVQSIDFGEIGVDLDESDEERPRFNAFAEELLGVWESNDDEKSDKLSAWMTRWSVSGPIEWLEEQEKVFTKASEVAINQLKETRKKYNFVVNSHVKQLVVEQLRAYTLQCDPFEQNPFLFCFTNATYDLRLGSFVPISKFNYCQMSCGKPWIEPTQAQRDKIAA